MVPIARIFLFIVLVLAIHLPAQSLEVDFSGWGYNFEVPVDTTWREYRIPVDLIDFSPWPVVSEMTISLEESDNDQFPDSAHYRLDLIHFPTGHLENFEDSLSVSTWSPNGTNVWVDYSSNTPDSSNTSLQFGYVRNDTLPVIFTLSIPDLGNNYNPSDTVKFWLKAQHPANLRRYILNSGIRRTDMFEDWRGIKTRIYRLNAFSDFMYWPPDTVIELTEMRWDYYLPDSPAASSAIYTEYPVIIYLDDISKVRVDGLLWDFDSPLNPPDSLLVGYYLGAEGFEEVLGQAVFVKHYYGMLFDELMYGYGIGLIARFGGLTSGTETLVGVEVDGNIEGEMNIPNQISISIDDSFHVEMRFPLYPPDTSWYQYHIPLEKIKSVFHVPDQFAFDSLKIKLMPEIYLSENCCGIILLDQIEIRRADSVLFLIDDFESTFDWQTETATNGSILEIQFSIDSPPGQTGNSVELNFGNEWQWGQFGGWIEKTIVFDSTMTLYADDILTIWLKDRQLTVDTKAERINIPTKLTLHQNYPNPFNPITTIRYELLEQTKIRLVIFDLLGKEVAVLADGFQGPGVSEIRWDATGNASGIYFYLLQTDQKSQIKKLVVLK